MKKKMPKVSIIVPFNNVENYIDECLQSIENQTLNDIEIILINDASTDNSRQIALEHAKNDSRIILLDTKERMGQGYARNCGIEIAKGEYIGFVDSDDFVEKNAFEQLYNSAKQNDTDITMCQVKEYDDLNGTYKTSDYYSLAVLNSFEDRIFSAEDTKDFVLDINVALWNKVYKSSYLKNLGEKFPEGYIYEDLPFFFGTYLPAKRIQIIWQYLYNYRVNRKNSTMRQVNAKILDRLPMVSLTYEKLKSFSFFKDMQKKIQGWIINDIFHRYTLLRENYHKEYFFLMKKIFKSLEISDINDEYWKSVYHFKGYLLVMNNSFEEFNQKVFNEYLDIHEVEDRIKSSTLSRDEVDKKIGLIYGDIEKNYKYTEQIVGNAESKTDKLSEELKKIYEDLCGKIASGYEKSLNQNLIKIEETKSDIYKSVFGEYSKVTAQTDEKISKVYDEITKNYEYTNKLNEDSKELAQNSIKETADFVTKDTDEKISKVYDEITKNYEYTNKLNEDSKEHTQNSIKETADFVTKDTDEKISKVYDEITKNYEYTNKLNNEAKELIEKKEAENFEKYTSELNTGLEKLSENLTEKQNAAQAETNSKITTIENETEKQIQTLNANFIKTVDKLQIDVNAQAAELKAGFTQTIDKVQADINNKTNSAIEEKAQYFEELNKNTSEILTNKIEALHSESLNEIKKGIENADIIKSELTDSISKTKDEVNTRTDDIASKIYDQIKTQNEYQNDINDKTNRFIHDVKNHFSYETQIINAKLSDTDGKLNSANTRINNVSNSLEQNKTDITVKTDEKISKIYENINNNYRYTEEEIKNKSKELYNDIKDLSYVIYNNKNEFQEALNNLLTKADTIKEELNSVKSFYDTKTEELRKEYNEKYIESGLKLQKQEIEAADKVSKLQTQLEEEKLQNKQYIENMKEEFEAKLQSERAKHEEEIEELKRVMKKNIENLKEELKPKIVKFFEKSKRKQVK